MLTLRPLLLPSKQKNTLPLLTVCLRRPDFYCSCCGFVWTNTVLLRCLWGNNFKVIIHRIS